jgi:hypothetical protein
MSVPNSPISIPPGVSLLHPESVPERSGVAATWSSIKRDGQWVLPRHFRALAMMGGVDLDLTQVVLGEGESEIECVAIMGSVKIIIPQGIHVICEGDSTFGSFDIKNNGASRAPEGAPIIRITGSAFMGSVDVNIWNPDKTSWLGRFLG